MQNYQLTVIIISASHTTFMPSCHGHLTNAADWEAGVRNIALDFQSRSLAFVLSHIYQESIYNLNTLQAAVFTISKNASLQ